MLAPVLEETIAETPSGELQAYHIGAILRQLRRRARLTLKGAGNASRLKESAMLEIEKGQRAPQLHIMNRLAKLYGVPTLAVYRAAALLEIQEYARPAE